MSAPFLQPIPATTHIPAHGGPHPPAADPWKGSAVPSAQASIPTGKLVLRSWPETSHPAQGPAPSAAGIPFSPLPPAPTPHGRSAVHHPFPPFEAVPAESPPEDPQYQDFAPFQPVRQTTATTSTTAAGAPPRQQSAPFQTSQSGSGRNIPPEADFTDDDLRDAFAPLLKGLNLQTAPSGGDLNLEPMLRATIRRALAEYSPTTGRPFTQPGAWDRFKWRMRALLTSRTYEDILFEKTNRFQVEEVFLLDSSTLALVSFASANPGRHASAKKVEGTVHRIAHQLREGNGSLRRYVKLPDGRNVIVREGSFINLLAIFRGMPNEMAINDLGYTLGSLEERFADRYRVPGSPLLQLMQPFLEDCLLIQAPAAAA